MTATTDYLLDDNIIAACDRLLKQYGGCENLTGIDVGYAWKNGRQTGRIALRLHVAHKIPPKFLHPDARFPRQFDGYQVDVIESRCDGASRFIRPDRRSWLDWFEKNTCKETGQNAQDDGLTPNRFQQMFSEPDSPVFNRLPTHPATSPDAQQMVSQWPDLPDHVLPCIPNPFPAMAPCSDQIRPNNFATARRSNRSWAAERLLAKMGQLQNGGTVVPEHPKARNAVALMQKVSLTGFVWPNLKKALFAEHPCFRELLPETELAALDLPGGAAEWIVSAVNYWPAFADISLRVPQGEFNNAVDFLDVLTSLHRALRKLGYEVI